MQSQIKEVFRVAVMVALGAACNAHAQQQDGKDAAAAAIGNAVQEGSSPYRPESRSDALAAECRELAAQIGGAPKRDYQVSGQSIETSQGRMVPELERERPRKALQEAYRTKCTQ
jgi:hypothetical protein